MEISGQQTVSTPSFPVFCYKELLEKMEETDDSGVIYPERDGKPMGETEIHVMAIIELCQTLRHFFRHHPDVYVIADMLMYYEKGKPGSVRVPDVMVVKGVGKRVRRTFKIWEEKTAPNVIFEITSKSTASEDMSKIALYSSLGVKEYFLFDPLEEYIEKSLMGFRMDGINCRPIPPDENGNLFSEELGLTLKQEGELLRLADPETGCLVPSLEEEARRADEAESQAKGQSLRVREAEKRAEEEAQKAARLAAKLREMGIDPDSV
ncbi:MAG: Uma2 family endonuclease [Desulfococcaceae bacterium]|jgi:Uma2 family endonuclease|nr:Uma2 family endonuclease [Desulfococcaceae bacterium]